MAQSSASDAFFYVLQDTTRILYVDDDPILREFAQVHLTTEHASVVVAEDGFAGLAALEAATPDVMLLDLEMPRMDGFEVLGRMRAEPRHAHIPVIVVTGRDDVSAIDRAYEAGATSFVVKPMNWRLLSYQIRYVHRTHQRELSLLDAARKAQGEVDGAAAALADLSLAGSRFLANALQAGPHLRAHAEPYLEVLEAISQARASAA
ncbi:PleD family two-component system response regulator [Phenylobacterium sp.]|uniref:response regulator n=1 Tax=Phenylobacterium sp. TaxID=1871053 RepID=UPI0027358DAA|nr:response regulator [Phenylobacterium sp.]MDP3661000.1 response regulator [Phenylobacterium sp.]